jgi:hypothetical protein
VPKEKPTLKVSWRRKRPERFSQTSRESYWLMVSGRWAAVVAPIGADEDGRWYWYTMDWRPHMNTARTPMLLDEAKVAAIAHVSRYPLGHGVES